MLVQAFTALHPYFLLAAASPYQHQSAIKPGDKCPKGVHIVGIRGTLEKPGFGALQDVVDRVLARVPGSDSVAIDYPASGITIGPDGNPIYDLLQYEASKEEGFFKFSAELDDFTWRCPETGIVVMGYSQGAHVVGDGLCGVTGPVFRPKRPIDSRFTRSIRAIIQLGDPTNVSGLPWHVGTSTRSGVFPRGEFSACAEFEDMWQSYCDSEDYFCDSGDSIPIHLGYVERARDNIVDFIVERVNKPESRGFEYRVKNEDL